MLACLICEDTKITFCPNCHRPACSCKLTNRACKRCDLEPAPRPRPPVVLIPVVDRDVLTLLAEGELWWVDGLSGVEYKRLLESQGGVCRICDSPPGKRALAVDHCHTTGRIRGLLCVRCNLALGAFGDDPQRFEAALAYLARAARCSTAVPKATAP